ncbi:MAG: hypothetical protein OFPI_00590 [Osedax symbiont Rs2]|nr:MAG: hypothetical protein OFPI_00590 [Osedax symbiont Rs2]
MEASSKDQITLVNSEEIIDLRQFWRVLMSQKWGILGFSVIVTLLTTLIVFNITPIFKGTSTLLIESQQTHVVSIQEVYGLDGSSEYLLTQFEILKSRSLAKKVILKYQLLNHPAYNLPEIELPEKFKFIQEFSIKETVSEYFPSLFSTQTEKSKKETDDIILENMIDSFLENLTVSPIKKTQLVKISFESSDPKLSSAMANAIGDTYIEDNLAAKLELTVKATTWLNKQLKGQRVELTSAEHRLQQYREKEKIIGIDGGLGMAEREIELVSSKLVDSRRERLELLSLYNQIQEIGSTNANRLQLIPSILGHALVQNLKEVVAGVELRRSEVSNRYGRKHPKMKAISSELSRAYSNLNKQIISIARGIENKYKISVETVKSLEGSLDETRDDMQQLSSKEFKLNELQQDVDTKRALFDQFYTRFSETSATGDLKTANARITDLAATPIEPIKPNIKLLVALAFFASFMFAVMVAFILRALDNTIKTSFDVETKLNEVLLGILPLLESDRRNQNPSYNHFHDHPHSTYSESLRTIRTGVILSSLDNPYKVISVTSSVPGEGKTSTSLGLAFSLAQVGTVLLIDADMRRPSIHKALELSPRRNGLSNLVAQTHEMEECISTYDEGDFDVLTCGILPPNPSELLSSKRFADLIHGLSLIYDKVIIDTAPCQAVSDALVLAPIVDAYLYVVKADSTTSHHARNGMKRIRQVNGNIAGVVLNHVDVKNVEKYYGEDYSGYYDNYGYTGANS